MKWNGSFDSGRNVIRGGINLAPTTSCSRTRTGTSSVWSRNPNDVLLERPGLSIRQRDVGHDQGFRQNEEDEMKPCVAVLLSLLLMRPAIAADGPPTQASVRELMQITQAQKLVESTRGQVDGMMQTSMNKALEGHP